MRQAALYAEPTLILGVGRGLSRCINGGPAGFRFGGGVHCWHRDQGAVGRQPPLAGGTYSPRYTVVVKSSPWPVARPIETARLTLEPLRVNHADEMVSVLDDESLYEFTGGGPMTLVELRDRYAGQVVGHSPDGAQGWLNWIVRQRASGSVIGTVQATVHDVSGAFAAELAWVIGSRSQGSGFAKEAAAAMLNWLRDQHVGSFTAHIRPDHAASIAVAQHIGLSITDEMTDGEISWAS
jgi:RimJ/RimL family protein N-acetyltransferase